MTVRPARATDGPRLRQIQQDALAEPWPDLLDVALGDGPVCLVVEAGEAGDGAVVGYAVALTADAPVAYVPELAVDPDFQGQGYGSTLLRELLATLRGRGIERVRLTVREGDRRARSFYDEHGFETVDRVPDHFATGDGLVLERKGER